MPIRSNIPGARQTWPRLWESGWYDLHDPWGQQYAAKFRVERGVDLLDIVSSGPDKWPGTADDFSIGTIRRSYFLPLQRLMERILVDQQDYPPTEKAFQELLGQ